MLEIKRFEENSNMGKCEEFKRLGDGLMVKKQALAGQSASHRRFLCQECDPFYIHTSIQSRNALSMRESLPVEGGRGTCR